MGLWYRALAFATSDTGSSRVAAHDLHAHAAALPVESLGYVAAFPVVLDALVDAVCTLAAESSTNPTWWVMSFADSFRYSARFTATHRALLTALVAVLRASDPSSDPQMVDQWPDGYRPHSAHALSSTQPAPHPADTAVLDAVELVHAAGEVLYHISLALCLRDPVANVTLLSRHVAPVSVPVSSAEPSEPPPARLLLGPEHPPLLHPVPVFFAELIDPRTVRLLVADPSSASPGALRPRAVALGGRLDLGSYPYALTALLVTHSPHRSPSPIAQLDALD